MIDIYNNGKELQFSFYDEQIFFKINEFRDIRNNIHLYIGWHDYWDFSIKNIPEINWILVYFLDKYFTINESIINKQFKTLL